MYNQFGYNPLSYNQPNVQQPMPQQQTYPNYTSYTGNPNPMDRLNQLKSQQSYPPQQPTEAPNQRNNELMGAYWVQGEEGAKAFYVPNGCSAILFDSEADVFYIKSVGLDGRPHPLQTFDYYKRVSNTQPPNRFETQPVQPSPDYVTREEFNRLSNLYSNIAKELGIGDNENEQREVEKSEG